MRRQPQQPQPEVAGTLDRGLEQRPAEAGAAEIRPHREPLDLRPVPAVLRLRPHDLHRPDDDTVIARHEQHPPDWIELRGRLDPNLARMLGRQRPGETERHVRLVGVQQQPAELVGGRTHLVGRELDDLHAETLSAPHRPAAVERTIHSANRERERRPTEEHAPRAAAPAPA